MKKIILIASAILIMTNLSGADDLYSRNFDWEPFKTGLFAIERPGWVNTTDENESLKFRSDHFFSLENEGGNGKGAQFEPKEFELEVRRLKFSLSRYAFNYQRDHSIRPSDLEKQREKLVQSLPSVLSGSSGQQKFETFGKIFEPNLNLRIEF